jgi:hypothetical protein
LLIDAFSKQKERLYGARLLRWVLAYYWEETYPLIIDSCYGFVTFSASLVCVHTHTRTHLSPWPHIIFISITLLSLIHAHIHIRIFVWTCREVMKDAFFYMNAVFDQFDPVKSSPPTLGPLTLLSLSSYSSFMDYSLIIISHYIILYWLTRLICPLFGVCVLF